MATEKRLIDANALSKKISNMKNEITAHRGGYRYCDEDEKNEWDKLDSFDSLVCDAPTVDAVEVVRCKDCVWFNQPGCAIYIVDDSDKPKETDFCSFGEREVEDG